MCNIWYLSPSNQSGNLGVLDYGSEMEQMYRLAEEIIPHLDRAGVFFHLADRNSSGLRRCEESNEMGAVFHLCLHSNAGGGGTARGPIALYYSEPGKAMGQRLVDALLSLGQKNNRSYNLTQAKYLLELKGTTAPACLLEVDFHDSPDGVAFLTSHRSEIAEAIAKVIIEADGKEFVPVTFGESTDLGRQWGLFDDTHGNYRWKDPLTREEAATLAVRLKKLIEKGVT